MASKHILKLTEGEAILKCYITSSSGGVIDINLETDLTRANEVYSAGVSKVGIRSIFWGTKNNKQIDITRVVTPPNNVHGHYYFVDTGVHDFSGFGFLDNLYADKDIRISSDGECHVIMVLIKSGWQNKIEPWKFGSYDDPNVVGS